MQFEPSKHTKEYLQNNLVDLGKLADYSREFAESPLSQDYDILSCISAFGFPNSVAHRLASIHKSWGLSQAAQNHKVLSIVDQSGMTTAHRLAKNNSKWLHTDAAKDYAILKLEDSSGITVAHTLAQHQKEWLNSDAVRDFEILSLGPVNGYKVAHMLAVNQPEWILSDEVKDFRVLTLEGMTKATVSQYLTSNKLILNMEHLLNKQVLSIEDWLSVSNAEYIVREADEGKINTVTMIMKMISQGAAYKHSKELVPSVGESVLDETQELMDECDDPSVNLKYALAAYSTCKHSLSREIACQNALGVKEKNRLDIWEANSVRGEKLIKDLLSKYPHLEDVDHEADINCEPGDELIKRIQSQKTFSDLGLEGNENDHDASPNVVSLY
jgi:hypothetical protein